MVVRSTGFRIIQVQTRVANALASLSLLDGGVGVGKAAAQGCLAGARPLKSLCSRLATPPRFTAVKQIVHSMGPRNGFLTQVSRSEHPLHCLSRPCTAGLSSAKLPEK